MYKQASLDDEPSVLLDPNEMLSDGTIALKRLDFSIDGNLLAYSFSKSGSDWEKIKIRNVETGQDYAETLQGAKFSINSWTHDNEGFFYSVSYLKCNFFTATFFGHRFHFLFKFLLCLQRYLNYGDGTEIDIDKNQKIYYHRVGEAQEKDILIAEFPENPEWIV